MAILADMIHFSVLLLLATIVIAANGNDLKEQQAVKETGYGEKDTGTSVLDTAETARESVESYLFRSVDALTLQMNNLQKKISSLELTLVDLHSKGNHCVPLYFKYQVD